MCVDFVNLNKACPKDDYPVPKIDQKVDATAGYELLSFLDAYSGYNQIPLLESDRIKTCFIAERGLYCYRVMPFGLKNAGATYQRLVNKMFKRQIGRTMEVYIDDMVVKSKKRLDHIEHLEETFRTLRQYGMKLNPAKCTFGVASGEFLGHIVNQRGIEANPTKVQALRDMTQFITPKDVQRLTGRIAALSRFHLSSFRSLSTILPSNQGWKRHGVGAGAAGGVRSYKGVFELATSLDYTRGGRGTALLFGCF